MEPSDTEQERAKRNVIQPHPAEFPEFLLLNITFGTTGLKTYKHSNQFPLF